MWKQDLSCIFSSSWMCFVLFHIARWNIHTVPKYTVVEVTVETIIYYNNSDLMQQSQEVSKF